ncbi:alpha/beta hydrolase [Dactylosporangium darangshiense]|uniref:Alpha/beta hydrolase n=1 Tax=Dactylosporangium darangshiense TaxID=579108 RepID=A0ABP8DP63_9ACTN
MRIAYLLVHSPLVGPASWAAVAGELRATGATVAVPSLTGIGDGGPPFWPRVTEAVAAAVGELPPEQPFAVVVHSSAGRFVPVIVRDLLERTRDVVGVVFVEAALPARDGPTSQATPERLAQLRGTAEAGLLPRWTDWWNDADGVARLFPDEATQRAVTDEQPRLPLSYYEHPVPNPPGWEPLTRGYIQFSPAYERVAADAAERGWYTVRLDGGHFHQTVDPTTVADAIAHLVSL